MRSRSFKPSLDLLGARIAPAVVVPPVIVFPGDFSPVPPDRVIPFGSPGSTIQPGQTTVTDAPPNLPKPYEPPLPPTPFPAPSLPGTPPYNPTPN